MEADGGSDAAASPGAARETAAPPVSGIDVQVFANAGLGLAGQERLGAELTADAAPILMAWQAPRALIAGRVDAHLPRFARAQEELTDAGWPVFVRRSGGSACPISPGTLQIALVRVIDASGGIDSEYRVLAGLLEGLLASLGVAAEIGERADAFCPGRYDMGVGPRKFAGLSQHWRPRGPVRIATTAATLIVEEDSEELSRIVNLFYERAGAARRCSPAAVMDVRGALPPGTFPDGALMATLRARLLGMG